MASMYRSRTMGWYFCRQRKVDAVADPWQCCLGYPEFPGGHWHAETTRTCYAFRNRKSI